MITTDKPAHVPVRMADGIQGAEAHVREVLSCLDLAVPHELIISMVRSAYANGYYDGKHGRKVE